VYGLNLSYPEGWQATPATRAWQPGDVADSYASSDVFVNPAGDLGYAVALAPAGDGADIESAEGLTAWATQYCGDSGLPGCATFADRAEPMCLDAGGDQCRPAILVRSEGKNPDDEGEYAFFPHWPSVMLTEAPDMVTVVATGRGDAYARAAQYGGAVELLKSVLSTMGVTPS